MSLRIKPENRTGWDIFVFVVIIYVTFELPYDICVGWKNTILRDQINMCVVIIFIIDMVLNCITERVDYNGNFWGIKNFIALFSKKNSMNQNLCDDSVEPALAVKQPEILISYICSVWFLIDFLSVFPFQMVFTQLRILNLSRVLRILKLPKFIKLLRLFRFFKSLRIIKIFERLLVHYPAIKRILLFCILVPFFAHIHACLLYFFESGNPNTTILNYRHALNQIFIAFTTSDEAVTVTALGFWTSVSAVLWGVLLLSIFIGNITALFNEMDRRIEEFELKRKEWTHLFNKFPAIFEKEIRNNILEMIHYKDQNELSKYSAMISSLNYELELDIKRKIKEELITSDDVELKKLDNFLSPVENSVAVNIGKILVQSDYISEQQLDAALQKQEKLNRDMMYKKIGEILLDSKIISTEQLNECLEKQKSKNQ